MAVLIVMVSISLEMVTRVSAAFWASAAAGALMGSDFTDGMTSQAMQQGGMGLILTTLIVTIHPWRRRSSRAHWGSSVRM